MGPEQLCFFKFPRPLLDRFGKEFFRDIPKSPGVYIFIGDENRVLYIGQSKNLRERLSYYKNAQPEREPGRIIRLVHQIRAIEIERCSSPEAARLRELALIGQHRPRFNVANTLSPAYTFFGLRECGARLALRISVKPARREGELLVGAFRSRALCARALCAMARTVVARERPIQSVFDFPVWLHDRVTDCQDLAPNWRSQVESFLHGEDQGFADETARLTQHTDPFLRQVFETDLVTLTEFFQLARQMRQARQFLELPILSQEALQVSAQQMRLHKMVPIDDPGISARSGGATQPCA